jgi:hypothetical protein
VTRARAEQYRRLAQECLAAARMAWTGEARIASLEMARSWFRLAEEQDNESANIAVPPPAAGESQPAAQQQQQIQPKDDDKKE